MSDLSFSSSEFSAYADALRQRESSDNYKSVTTTNGLSFYGAYQFGSSALIDAGFLDAKGNWTSLAKSFGVTSFSTFLSTPLAQDAAFENFTEKNFDYLKNYQSYVGKTVGGIVITQSGMLAGAHLVGQRAVKTFLNTNGAIIRADGNGIPITEYMTNYSQYNFTFPANSSGFSATVNIQSSCAPDQEARKGNKTIISEANTLDGKTPVEKLRHYAAQARAKAEKKPVRGTKIKHRLRNQVSYVPTPNRQRNPMALNSRGGSAASSALVLAGASLRNGTDEPLPNVTLPGALHPARAGIAPENMADAGPVSLRLRSGSPRPSSRAIRVNRAGSTAELAGRSWARSMVVPVASRKPQTVSFAPAFSQSVPQLPTSIALRRRSGAAQASASLQRGPVGVQTASSLAPRTQSSTAAKSETMTTEFTASNAMQQAQVEQALNNYWYQQSRLPPSGATAFDPRLTPAWAGMKLPA